MKRFLLVGAAAMVLGLTACGGTSEVTSLLGPLPVTTSVAPTPEPEATYDPLDTDENGEVSEFERQVAGQHAVRDYALLDGTIVSVDPNLPLADTIKADVLVRIAPALEAVVAANATPGAQAAAGALGTTVSELGASLGAEIIVVAPGSNGYFIAISSALPSFPVEGSTSRDEMISRTQTWAGSRFQVLVM